VRQALQEFGRAALFESGPPVDDEVLLETRRVNSRSLQREGDAGIAPHVLKLPLIARQVSGDELLALEPDPNAGDLRRAVRVQCHEVRERARLNQLASAIGEHRAKSCTKPSRLTNAVSAPGRKPDGFPVQA
jgi:hypothetical protein